MDVITIYIILASPVLYALLGWKAAAGSRLRSGLSLAILVSALLYFKLLPQIGLSGVLHAWLSPMDAYNTGGAVGLGIAALIEFITLLAASLYLVRQARISARSAINGTTMPRYRSA